MNGASHILKAGWGAETETGGFWRATEDTPVRLSADSYAKPQHCIVYRASDNLRLHVQKRALIEIERK
jgi:hypothetical protein